MVSHELEAVLQTISLSNWKIAVLDQVHAKQREIQYVALKSSMTSILKAMYILVKFIFSVFQHNSE